MIDGMIKISNNMEDKREELVKLMLEKTQDLGLSDASAAKQIGISGGYYSQIKNRQWQNIAEATWNKVAAWVNLRLTGWQAGPTRTFKRIYSICQHAVRDGIAMCICDEPEICIGHVQNLILKHDG